MKYKNHNKTHQLNLWKIKNKLQIYINLLKTNLLILNEDLKEKEKEIY